MPKTKHKYKFYAHIDSIREKILCLEKEIVNENVRLTSALSLIAEVEALEKKIEADREQAIEAETEYLLSFCQNRAKAKKLLFEIKNRKFG